MSAGITLDACVSTRVRTPLGPTIALVLLVSACLMMGSTVKVPDVFSVKKKLQCELRDFREEAEVKDKYNKPMCAQICRFLVKHSNCQMRADKFLLFLPFPHILFPFLPD